MKLVTPAKLKPGDTIGVIAPSAGNANFFPHRVDSAVAFFEKEGYQVVFGKHAKMAQGYVSASPEERASDINDMFADENVKAIICTIGGNHSNQLVKYIDFDLVSRNPKIFLGYSDISVLHYAFLKKAGLRTYYGPCLMTQFGEFPRPLEYTYEYFNRALRSLEPVGEVEPSSEWTTEILDWSTKADLTRPRKLLSSEGYEWLRAGRAQAEIVGGCVPSINHAIGTDFWLDPTERIFFIDIPEGHEFGKGLPISELDAYLADLDNIGVFSRIKGLIVGRPYNYSTEQMEELRSIVRYYTRDYTYPILLNANIGHADPIITLPYFAEVTLDSENEIFAINNP